MKLPRLTPPRTFIYVNREHHRLKLWQRSPLRVRYRFIKSYPVAVGRPTLETDPGIYYVNRREKPPGWVPPDSQWVRDAGITPGVRIPPGPNTPIQGAWLGLDNGQGIHGIPREEYGSLGTDASHGCVRMTVEDVLELWDYAKNGTPVHIE